MTGTRDPARGPFEQLPARRILVVIGAPGSGKTQSLERLAGLVAGARGFVQHADAAQGQRRAYTLVNLADGERRIVAWRSTIDEPYTFDEQVFERAAAWIEPAPLLVLDELGKLEAEGEGHARALHRALATASHLACAVRADRWPELRRRFALQQAIPLQAGDVGGAHALLRHHFRSAHRDDIARLQSIERDADIAFAAVGHPELCRGDGLDTESAARFIAGGQIVVAEHEGEVAAFAYVGRLDGEACLGQISVAPEHGRRGLGTALLRLVVSVLRAHGEPSVVLSTQRDVAWNAPWYARHGFREIESSCWTPAMHRLQAQQAIAGLDTGSRLLMRLDLGDLACAAAAIAVS